MTYKELAFEILEMSEKKKQETAVATSSDGNFHPIGCLLGEEYDEDDVVIALEDPLQFNLPDLSKNP